MSIKKKVANALMWTIGQQVSVQVLVFVIQLFLARLLAPDAFGLIAMVQIFIAVGQKLVDSGLTTSLIRTPMPDNKDYSSVFYLNLVMSGFVYVVIFVVAPFVADFYQQPELSRVLRVISLSIIIEAFVSVQNTRLTKEMNFRMQMMLQIPSYFVGGAVGVLMAYHGFGVWSLVWMSLVRSAVWAIQHWIFTGWRPEKVLDWARLKTHLRFGYKIMISGVIDALYNNVLSVLIGRFFPLIQLGYYDRANMLRQLPVQTLSGALNKVSFPLFANMQSDEEKLKVAYKKMMQLALFIIAPVMILALVLAQPIISILLGSKWLPAVPYFQVLCLIGILMPIHAYNLNILNVKGRSDLFLRLEIIKRVVLTVLILAGLPFGIYGLLYAQLIATVISFFVNSYYSGRMIQYPTWDQVKDLSPILLITAVSGTVVWSGLNAWKELMMDSPPALAALVAGTVVFVATYLLFARLLKISTFIDIYKYVFRDDSGK